MYKLKWYTQVFLYLIGIPVHLNKECVIDFSCCFKELEHTFAYRLNIVLGRMIKGHWCKLW